ncbi:MAG: hypothetical protein P8H45_05505 [Flavobacteriaceae bacterium]|nr:hypothetical protein [Flavobacteriaceae bacterium]
MKKWIFLLIIPFVFACNADENCGKVIDKVVKENRYLLVIRFDDGASTSQSEFSGELVSDIEVSEDMFSKLTEGENYCVE